MAKGERTALALIGGALAVFLIMYINTNIQASGTLYFTLARTVSIIISMIGAYIIVRAGLILLRIKELPCIKLIGGTIIKCCTLLIVGLAIGFFAPVWSTIIWFGGAITGFFTNAFE